MTNLDHTYAKTGPGDGEDISRNEVEVQEKLEVVEQEDSIAPTTSTISEEVSASEPKKTVEASPAVQDKDRNEYIKGTEKEWDGKSVKLSVGLTFLSRSEAKKFVKMYGNSLLSKMSITDGGASDGCKSRKLVWGCTYGNEKPSVATECRPNQHSKKKNCGAFIRFYCRGSKDDRSVCVLTAFSEEHNHARTKSMYDQDAHKIEEEEETKWLKGALTLNVKAAQVKNMMKKMFDKSLSTRHVRHMMNKMQGPDLQREELATYLEQIEEGGGKVEVLLDTNDRVRGLAVQTAEMRKCYLGAQPDVVMVDTTFNFETAGYKLSAICYCNPVSSRGEVAELVYLADEGSEAYEFAFSAFRKTVNKDPPNILVDKDFNEITVIEKIFPSSTIFLCQFHVLKWWKKLVSTAKNEEDSPVDYDMKKLIMESFRSLVYAHSNEIYDKELKQFEEVVNGVEVRVGQAEKANFVDLNHYFVKNWANCEGMWTMHMRRNIVGLEDINTNNHLERLWRTMKDFLKQMTSGAMSIFKAVLKLVRFSEEILEEKYTWDRRHKMRIFDQDPGIREEYIMASEKLNDRGMLKFKESVQKMRNKEGLLSVHVMEEGEERVQEVFRGKPKVGDGNDEKKDEMIEEDYENAAMILRDPDNFCLKAETGSMKDWYPSSQVEGRREEMAGLIRRMGNDQREPGQVHETQEALNLQDFKVKDFKKYMKVKVDKKIAKQMVDSTKGKRKCGLCSESGHYRNRCPMKEDDAESAPPPKRHEDDIYFV